MFIFLCSNGSNRSNKSNYCFIPQTLFVGIVRIEVYVGIILIVYAPTFRAGENIEVIETLPAVREAEVSLRLETPPKSVRCVPQNQEIPFCYEQQVLQYTIPEFVCHQIIQIVY